MRGPSATSTRREDGMTKPTRTDTASPTSPARRPSARAGKTKPRESIIAIAIDLFSQKGYAKTTLAEVARKAGIEPSSLYYYFPSKSSLLEAIFTSDDHVPPLEELTRFSRSRTEQLYALIVHDTVHKCELPFDFIEMEAIAKDEPKHFTSFFEYYQAFYCRLVEVIEAGVAEGEFSPCEADERAVTILSINEGLQHHFHAKVRGELLLEVSGYTVRNHTPEEIGHMSAASIVPSLMAHPASFGQAARNGMRLYYRLEEERRSNRG